MRATQFVAALALSAVASALPLVPRQQTCYSGFYIIVARGSLEAAGEGKPGQVAMLIESLVPGSASVAVDYPASVDDPLYPTSVTDGINDTIDKIHAYVDACGAASRIVLLGFRYVRTMLVHRFNVLTIL